jgi:23S rRNA (cytidine1920-2'-O)/16S rRNA (cytidine1409-2'-O)-methyltransferase
VAGAPTTKPARLVAASEPIEVLGPPPRYVGRGGLKLEAALDRFAVPVKGRAALDAGASTGGFTDCLLQRGASRVVAVDVGRGQLHERLRRHPRVAVLERTDIRHLSLAQAGGCAFPLLVADLSFISLRSVAPSLLGPLAAPGADVVVLVKPQFEAGQAEASRGRGVIRDPAVWHRTLQEVAAAFWDGGAAIMEAMPSPLRGADGNVEFLLHAQAHRRPEDSAGPPDLSAVVEEAAVPAPGV